MGQVTDYSPEAENPRDCCANLAMTFRMLCEEAQRGAWPVGQRQFEGWASRLERAVRMLDQEKAQHQRDVDEYNHLSHVLFEYGRHRPDCSFRPAREIPGGREERIPCNCGFHETFAPPHGLSPIPKSWLKP